MTATTDYTVARTTDATDRPTDASNPTMVADSTAGVTGAGSAAGADSTGRRHWAPLIAVELATVVAGIANGITMVAFPWLVLEITGSPAAAGVIAGVTAIPTIIAALFAGSFVDLIGRRRTSILSDALSMISVLLVPLAAATGHLGIAVLSLVAVLGAVLDPAGMAARESMVPAAARAAKLPLERVNGIHEAAWGVAFLIGPAIGGLLIGFVGATTTFFATAVCFGLSILVIAVVRIPDAGRPDHGDDRPAVWAATREGLAFLRSNRLLRNLAVLYMFLVATYMPIQAIILPAWFESRGEPERLGTLLLALSLGGVIGALIYSAVAPRVSRYATLVAATLITTVPILALALLPPFAVMLALGFVSGVAWGPVNPLVNLAIQRSTPDELLGRLTGLFNGLSFALAPVGYLVAGALYGIAGPQWTLALFGAGLVIGALLILPRPATRLIDSLPEAHARDVH